MLTAAFRLADEVNSESRRQHIVGKGNNEERVDQVANRSRFAPSAALQCETKSNCGIVHRDASTGRKIQFFRAVTYFLGATLEDAPVGVIGTLSCGKRDREWLRLSLSVTTNVHTYKHSLLYLLFSVHRLALECAGVGARSPAGRASSGENRASRSTSRFTIANKKPAESPHISTPVTLSTAPKVRHVPGRRRSPEPTVE
jgi:hypothetical protein